MNGEFLTGVQNQDWLVARAQATPGKLALIVGERRWTYGELDTAVAHAAGFLHRQGIQTGDFVAVHLPSDFAHVCLIHALARLGAVLVPLNTRLTPAELTWQIDHVGAKWLLTNNRELKIENGKKLMVNESWFTPQPPLTTHNSQFTIHNCQAIVFTSGTSGQPKGAMLTFSNHFYSAIASAFRLGVQPDDVWLSVLPLYHVGGLAVVFRSCLYGTTVDLHPRFDLDTINHALDTRSITLISVVPTMLRRLWQTRTHWPASLRLILLGGAAAPQDLVQEANNLPRAIISRQSSVTGEQPVHNSQFSTLNSPLLPLVATTYGLTEAASQVATQSPADTARKPGSVGKPLLFTTVKIVDGNGNEQPAGVHGEIVVAGPTVMAGYFSKESKANAAKSSIVNRQSSIKTGDIGYLDDDGDLWLVQRRSDLIVSGGENVYPAEVEAVLRQHPAVAEACVVGVPDAEWGQRVAAMVALRSGETAVTPDTLIHYCRQRLAGYKIPRQLALVDALPLTASGKIARRKVAHILQS